MPCYRAHGLTWQSDLDLEGLAPRVADAPADVEVRRGPVPREFPDLEPVPGGRARPGLFLLEGDSRILVEGGRRITVEVGRNQDLARLCVAGPAAAALLWQRGCLVLHANAVEVHGRALLLCGPSGSGKSATAAALGVGRHLADDVAAVQFGSVPNVPPGFGPLKVRTAALPHRGLAEGWVPVGPGLPRAALPFDPGEAPVPLDTVYLLGSQGRALRGAALVVRAPLLVYRHRLATALGRAGDVLLGLASLASAVRVVELPAASPGETARAVREELRDRLLLEDAPPGPGAPLT